MAHASEITAPAPAGGSPAAIETLEGKHVCPFCGSVNESDHGVCPRCTMENTPASRKATKLRIGPWYVLQTRNPAAPGMRFETLLAFVKKGRVKPRSIVRGPTTHQLWRFAAHVKGLSREFGLCYSCGASILPTAGVCAQCNRLQDAPPNPDALLESDKEATRPVVPAAQEWAAPERAARPQTPRGPAPLDRHAPSHDRAAAAAAHQEPSLETGDAEFNADHVAPAHANGQGSEESMAGFSMNGSMSGVNFDPAWARLDPARPAPPPRGANGNGNGYPQNSADAPNFAAGFQPGPRGVPRKTENEGFLSAKDLAAAFKLGVEANPRAGAPIGAGLGAAGPAAPAFQPDVFQIDPLGPPHARPRTRRFGVLKLLLIVLLLGGALFGAAIAIDEPFRQQAFAWFAQAKATVVSGLSSDGAPPRVPGALGSTEAPDYRRPPAKPATSTTPRPAAAPASEPAAADTAEKPFAPDRLGNRTNVDPAVGPEVTPSTRPAAAEAPVPPAAAPDRILQAVGDRPRAAR